MSIESVEFHTNEKKKEILSEEDKKFFADSIEDLRTPTQKILEKLHNKIEKGEYTIIIGDDSMGRIPTLILGGVIKELYKEKHFPSPLVRFIAGGIFSHGNIVSEFNEYAEKLKSESKEKFGNDHAQKILIVTEFIATSNTVESLIMNFKAKGMPCDVATIGSQKNIFQRFYFGKRMGSKITRGQKNPPIILRWLKAEIIGVVKDSKSLFSESFRVVGHESDKNKKVQAVVNEVREDVKKLTCDLIIWYNDIYKRSEK